jgi:putative DNA primase/helicase
VPLDIENSPPAETPPPMVLGSGESKLAWALYLASKGFEVFPLTEKGTPTSDGWQAMATTDPERIRAMWTDTLPVPGPDGRPVVRYRNDNIGIKTDGLLVFDIDVKKHPDAFRQFQEYLLGDLGVTFETRSTSGGGHVYYLNPDRDRRSTVNLEKLPIDIKAVGGYVVGPGSEKNGLFYTIANNVPLKPLPLHLWKRTPPLRKRRDKSATVSSFEEDAPGAVEAMIRLAKNHAPVEEGGRGEACYQLALVLRDHGLSVDTTTRVIAEYWAYRCDPPFPLEDEKHGAKFVEGVRTSVENAYRYAQNAAGCKAPAAVFDGVTITPLDGQPSRDAGPRPPPPPIPPAGQRWLEVPKELVGLSQVILDAAAGYVTPVLTEGGLADAFVTIFGNVCRYDWTAGQWYWFHGDIWRPDETGIALLLMRFTCEWTANSISDAALQAKLRKLQFVRSALEFAKINRAVAITRDAWNRDPWKFATPNGTVNLRTGQLLPPDPADLITQIAAVGPAEEENCPIWLQFLHFALGGDECLIEFIRRWLGYCLTGDTREQALVFIYGKGGNGKGVLMHVITKIMGSYAVTAPMQTFTLAKGEKHPTDLDALRGYRLVTAFETQKGRVFDEQRIKGLTGGDEQSSRGMNENFSTWDPVLKLLFSGNNRPGLQSVGDAERRRFNLVPFDRKPTEEQKDLQLEAKLKDEWPSILRWAISGCLAWQQGGLQRPQVVLAATTEYFQDQDPNARWLAERVILDAGARERPTALLDNLNRWRMANEEDPIKRKEFRDWVLAQSGLGYVTVSGADYIKGAKLRDNFSAETPPPAPSRLRLVGEG